MHLNRIWKSWVWLCDGSSSKNMKSLLQECASCHPFRVTKGSVISSHRCSLPLKQNRTATNVFLQRDGASQDECEEIRRVRRGGEWNRWLPLLFSDHLCHTYTSGCARICSRGGGGGDDHRSGMNMKPGKQNENGERQTGGMAAAHPCQE